MTEELFTMIPGYNDRYLVSNRGRIISLNSGSEMAQHVHRNGYVSVQLSNGGKVKTRLIHRLVALAFVPNPNDCAEVNHIDGNKLNNSAENLEWVTRSQNMKHSIAHGLYDPVGIGHMKRMTEKAADTHRRRVVRDDGVVFDSVKDAAASVGGGAQNVSAVCRGRWKSCKGHVFAYEEDLVRRARALAERDA